MIYRTLAASFMAMFYILCIVKYAETRKEAERDKSKIPLMCYAAIMFVAQSVSIIIGKSYLPIMGKVIGVYFGVTADILFLFSILSKKRSLRNGKALKKDERILVTDGIYKYSRNPVYLSFMILYIGVCLMYLNIPLAVLSIVGITVYHIYLLWLEKVLSKLFEDRFSEYKKKTRRYLGYGKISVKLFCAIFYFLLIVWCIFYLITLICYAGIFLSWIWIWVLIMVCALIRFVMIKREIDGKAKRRISVPIRVIYYSLYMTALCLFLFVEANVFKNMSAEPKDNLEYVIVLGAGVNGKTPSIPLAKRIEEGYIYMSENPDTVLIASGGQGFLESISEAECIKNELVRMGIDEDRIILEDKSESTIENLKFSMEIIGDKSANVGIITNSFHEYRALLIAKEVGYENAYSVPAVTLFPVGIHYMLREFFGVVRLWMKFGHVVF